MEAMETKHKSSPRRSRCPRLQAYPLAGGAAAAACAGCRGENWHEDFAKVEMRVGQIKTGERIVGADNL